MTDKPIFQDEHCRTASFNEWRRCEGINAEKRRERQRQRDAAYARWERENGVSERVVSSADGVTTVIRGQFCIGARSAGRIRA